LANLNRIILVGRLTADPETRETVEGLPVAKFRLAINRPISGGNATDFIDIVAWRQLAETCGQHLKKGKLTLVEGRIQNRSYENQSGQKVWVTEVVANAMTMLDKGPGAGDQGPVETKDESVPDEEAPVEDADLASDLPF
jgi:single-strand DNA-binding protein